MLFRSDRRFRLKGSTAELLAATQVSFQVAEGEVVSLIGPSGCGKSTLLNLGAGLAPPSAGSVRVAGAPVSGPNPQVAFMLQKDLLLPWRTVLDNAVLGMEIQGVPRPANFPRAGELVVPAVVRAEVAALKDAWQMPLRW